MGVHGANAALTAEFECGERGVLTGKGLEFACQEVPGMIYYYLLFFGLFAFICC